jgi:hypothetical protein
MSVGRVHRRRHGIAKWLHTRISGNDHVVADRGQMHASEGRSVRGADIDDLIEGASEPRAALHDLRRRGLELVRCELPEVRSGKPVVALRCGWAAWFVEPGSNEIRVLQYR